MKESSSPLPASPKGEEMSCKKKEMDKDYDYCTADPINYELLKDFANNHKQQPTEAESFLWGFLKRSSLGKPFRRQHIIGNYIADFFCLPARLVVEIDGGYHQLPLQQVDDKTRTEWLEEKGFKVIRFTNEEVIGDIESVLHRIKENL